MEFVWRLHSGGLCAHKSEGNVLIFTSKICFLYQYNGGFCADKGDMTNEISSYTKQPFLRHKSEGFCIYKKRFFKNVSFHVNRGRPEPPGLCATCFGPPAPPENPYTQAPPCAIGPRTPGPRPLGPGRNNEEQARHAARAGPFFISPGPGPGPEPPGPEALGPWPQALAPGPGLRALAPKPWPIEDPARRGATRGGVAGGGGGGKHNI